MEKERVDSRGFISDYIFFSKYSRVKPDGKKETWEEAVDRVMQMHREFFKEKIKPENRSAFESLMEEVTQAYKDQRILGSQRTLQYGGPQLLKNNLRSYNCSASYLNRVSFFQELAELLLSGAGAGFSVQKVHINQLPSVLGPDRSNTYEYVIPDSIEGWARSWGILIESYFNGTPRIKFDYSQIREEGSYVSGGFKAPGPLPLRKSHKKIIAVLDKVKDRKLTPFEAHYITCLIADAVISGGIRRSAMISLFDIDDEEMLNCKTGDWFISYPELCRSNNSVVILPSTPKEKYNKIFKSIKEYGEPGIVFLEDQDMCVNPCCEVGLFPQYQNEDGSIDYGWGVCNLTEINGGKIETAGDFFYACRNAAILGTMQAAYTENFPLLKATSKKIIERDALIGVGITGMADNPEVLFSPEVQKMGAEIVRKTNESVAKVLGINPAARTTVVKPSGNSSQLLGTASGIHAYHFRKYIRNIQASNNEQAMQAVKELNPDISAASFWNKEGETVLSFPIELDDEALVRTDFSTLDFLKRIYDTERNWIMEGTRRDHPSSLLKPKYHHNVSCTVSVREEEWEDIADWIWNHREGFCGLSFLPETGDLDYPQAPYTSYLDEKELADTYGKGAVLSSGLIVDGLKVFGDIWTACNAATGKADSLLTYSDDYLLSFIKKHLVDGKLAVDVEGVIISDVNTISDYLRRKVESRQDWVRRFKKFSKNYFNGDDKHCSNCLKHVNIFHQWHKIKNINPVDWNSIKWETVLENAGEQVGTACAGGACSI